MRPVVKVVQPSGILDITQAGNFRQEISDLVESNVNIVLVDFQDVTFMDSSGLGALDLALKTVRAAGGRFFLCSLNEQIQMLLKVAGQDGLFEIYPSREEFEKAVLNTN